MNFKIKYKGLIENGQLIMQDERSFAHHLQRLEGKIVDVIVKKFIPYKERTNKENRYFHGPVLDILSDHTGYTPEEMKGILKWIFKVPSTSGLSTVEMEKFLTQIRQWASIELNCYIPLPDEAPLEY